LSNVHQVFEEAFGILAFATYLARYCCSRFCSAFLFAFQFAARANWLQSQVTFFGLLIGG